MPKDTVTTKATKRPARVAVPEVPWFILFFDLVIVAAFSQVAHVYGADPTWANYGYVAGCILFVFALWGVTTLELLQSESWVRRVIVLVQIVSLVVGALALGHGRRLESPWGFAALSIAVGCAALLVGLRARAEKSESRGAVGISLWMGAASVIYLAGTIVADTHNGAGLAYSQFYFYAGTILLVVVAAIHTPRAIARPSVSRHAVQERLGLILLIVLGESFLMLLGAVSSKASVPEPAFLVGTIVIVFSVWLLYFPGLAHAPLPETMLALRARVFAHFLLILSCADAIVAASSIAKDEIDYSFFGGFADTWTAFPLMGIVGAIAWMTWLRDRRWTPIMTVLALTFIVVGGLTVWGTLVMHTVANVLLLVAIGVVLLAGIVSVVLTRLGDDSAV